MHTITASFRGLSAILTMILFILCVGVPGISDTLEKDKENNPYNIPRVRPYERWKPYDRMRPAARRDGTLTPIPGRQETQEEGYKSKSPRSGAAEDGDGEVPTGSLEEDIIDPWEEYREPGYPNDAEDDVWKFQKADERADDTADEKAEE